MRGVQRCGLLLQILRGLSVCLLVGHNREPWASTHRGKWGQLTPLEKWMKNKLKSENMQKKSSFLNGRWGERHHADHIFIQIYFRMHHFVVKFSKFSSSQAAIGY